MIKIIGNEEWKIKDMLTAIGLKNRENFMDVYLAPAMRDGFVRMLYPDSPRHPRQKYLLTAKGMGLYKLIQQTI